MASERSGALCLSNTGRFGIRSFDGSRLDLRRRFAMDVEEVIKKARDPMTVRRVYGEPYDRDGSTIIRAQPSDSSSCRLAAGAGIGWSTVESRRPL